MTEKIKYSVEIFCIKKSIITFDFGSFAVAIKYDESPHVYFGTDYRRKFMGEVSEEIDEELVVAVKISKSEFEKIKQACSNLKTKTHDFDLELWRLLARTFTEKAREFVK